MGVFEGGGGGGGGSKTIDDLLALLPVIDSGTTANISTNDLDMLNVLFNSTHGMAKVAASMAAMNAVAASVTASKIIAASSVAMTEIIAAPGALGILVSNSIGHSQIIASASAIAEINNAATVWTAPNADYWNAHPTEVSLISANVLFVSHSNPASSYEIYMGHVNYGKNPTSFSVTSSIGFREYYAPSLTISYIVL